MSHEYIAKTFKQNGYTVKIIQDTDAQNPRKDCGYIGKMVCWHSRHNLGDEMPKSNPGDWLESLAFDIHPDLENYLGNGMYLRICKAHYGEPLYAIQHHDYRERRKEIINEVLDKHYIMLPLGLIDHSGISMYVGSGAHSCDPGGWDSGQVGWIYITVEDAIREWGGGNAFPGKKITPEIRAQAIKRMEWEVKEYDQYLTGDVYGYVIEDPDGEDVDSCWGFFGLDYCIEEAKQCVPSEPAISNEEEDAFDERLG